jgi:hypothetical protein
VLENRALRVARVHEHRHSSVDALGVLAPLRRFDGVMFRVRRFHRRVEHVAAAGRPQPGLRLYAIDAAFDLDADLEHPADREQAQG